MQQQLTGVVRKLKSSIPGQKAAEKKQKQMKQKQTSHKAYIWLGVGDWGDREAKKTKGTKSPYHLPNIVYNC